MGIMIPYMYCLFKGYIAKCTQIFIGLNIHMLVYLRKKKRHCTHVVTYVSMKKNISIFIYTGLYKHWLGFGIISKLQVLKSMKNSFIFHSKHQCVVPS